jgi:uncharacterized glyoxalase superfamily protein PhnB
LRITHKIVPCLWYDGEAEDAAKFYAQTFPDSGIVLMDAMMQMKKIDVATIEAAMRGRLALGVQGQWCRLDETLRAKYTSITSATKASLLAKWL